MLLDARIMSLMQPSVIGSTFLMICCSVRLPKHLTPPPHLLMSVTPAGHVGLVEQIATTCQKLLSNITIINLATQFKGRWYVHVMLLNTPPSNVQSLVGINSHTAVCEIALYTTQSSKQG